MSSGASNIPTVSGGQTNEKVHKETKSALKTNKQETAISVNKSEKEQQASATSLPPWSERYPAKAKAVLWTFVQSSSKIYESTPSKTMKWIALGSAIVLFLGMLSLVLAQKDEAVPNKYGMAFPLQDSASANAEKRVPFGIPGEGAQPTPVSDDQITTTEVGSGAELPTTVKPEDGLINGQDGTVLIAGDETEEKPQDNDQRIVFIERLMGLHLSAPGGQGQPDQDPESAENNEQEQKNKLNAKWASRTRKFSFPIPSDSQPNQAIPSDQPHPMLRYAAAAMMSRLIAAAARAQMESQAREAIMARGSAKSKDDDDEEDQSVPVLLATVRDDQLRQSPPMYGRPMPRPMMRSQPPISMARQQMAHSMPHRIVASPPQAVHPMLETIQRLQALQAIQQLQQLRQRQSAAVSAQREPGTQSALAMVVIPIQSQESRQAPIHASPYASPYGGMPPMSPYASYGYAPRPAYYPSPYAAYGHPAASMYSPMHMPAPSMAYPHYARSPYGYSHPAMMQPRSYMPHPAYSHSRPIIEVPIEVPVHVPVPVAVRAEHRESSGPNRVDHDASSSDQDHIVLLYDAEVSDDNNNESDLQESASDAHEKMSAYGPKGHPFLSRPLPSNPSLAKLKLWRELVAAKHAAQPGVRYMPIAIAASDDSQTPPQPIPLMQHQFQQAIMAAHQQHQQQQQQQPQEQQQPQQSEPMAQQTSQAQEQFVAHQDRDTAAGQQDQQQQPALIVMAGAPADQADEQQ